MYYYGGSFLPFPAFDLRGSYVGARTRAPPPFWHTCKIKYLRAIPQLIRNRIRKMERTPPAHFRIRVQQRARDRFQTIGDAADAVVECGRVARLRVRF